VGLKGRSGSNSVVDLRDFNFADMFVRSIPEGELWHVPKFKATSGCGADLSHRATTGCGTLVACDVEPNRASVRATRGTCARLPKDPHVAPASCGFSHFCSSITFKELPMYWPLLAASALAIGCLQLGAMSVWVTVLSLSLKAVLLAVAIATLLLGAVALRRSRTRLKQ
jgi:hypothetical protein